MPSIFHLDAGFAWVLRTTVLASIMALAILVVQWGLRARLSPSVRYAMWLIFVARLGLPFSPESAWSVFNLTPGLHQPPVQRETPVVQPAPTIVLEAPAALRLMAPRMSPDKAVIVPEVTTGFPAGARIGPGVWTWLWLAGVIVVSARLIWVNRRFSLRIQNAEPVTDEAVLEVLRECQRQVGGTGQPALIATPEVESPALFGCWRPRLLVPIRLLSVLSRQELRCVFLHELAHLKRWDPAVNGIATGLQVLHWFNPMIWYAMARMRSDRELACDALALSCANPGENTAYGATIIKLLEGFDGHSPTPGLVGIVETGNAIRRRIAMIADFQKPWRWTAMGLLAMAAFGLATLTDAQTAKILPINPILPAKNQPGEREACLDNLRRIYTAIEAYRKDHHELPNWLSDLVPDYLSDTNILVCPVHRRTAETSVQAVRDPVGSTTYSYEFAPIESIVLSDGRRKSLRDYTTRVLAIMGPDIPLVRCYLHEPVLNIGHSGVVYVSPLLWPELIVNSEKRLSLVPEMIYADAPPPGQKLSIEQVRPNVVYSQPAGQNGGGIGGIPARDPAARPQLIDLTPYYNSTLTNGWIPNRSLEAMLGNNLAELPPGVQRLAGVEFDLRGVIHLSGIHVKERKGVAPERKTGIVIGQKAKRLHFLQGTAWEETEGTRIGSYTVFYDDGKVLEIPINYGEDLRDWQYSGDVPQQATKAEIGWVGRNIMYEASKRSLRLFKKTWVNPRPDVAILSLDFNSAMTVCAPFLVAVTAD